MGLRRDVSLAVLSLAVVGAVTLQFAVSLSSSFLAVGALGALFLELITQRYPGPVRRWWDRPVVQGGAVVGVGTVAVVGAIVAPVPVLSILVGGLVAYLLMVGFVLARRRG